MAVVRMLACGQWENQGKLDVSIVIKQVSRPHQGKHVPHRFIYEVMAKMPWGKSNRYTLGMEEGRRVPQVRQF